MRNCFVPWCDLLRKDQPRRCMFHPPKNMYEIWKAALPKQKKFRPTDKVCEHHFHESDVLRNFEQIINGEIFKLERGRAKLKPTAVPCLNLPPDDEVLPISKRGRHPKPKNETENSILTNNKRNQSDTKEASSSSSSSSSPSSTKKRKMLNHNMNRSQKKDITVEITECSNIERLENPDEIEDIYLDETLLQAQFDTLYDDIFEVVLPNTLWGIHRDPNKKCIAITYFDCDMLQTTKSIIFNNKGELKIFLYDKLYTEELISEMSYELLSSIINQIDEMRICINAKISVNINSGNICNDKCLLKIDNSSNDDNSDTDLCSECKKLL